MKYILRLFLEIFLLLQSVYFKKFLSISLTKRKSVSQIQFPHRFFILWNSISKARRCNQDYFSFFCRWKLVLDIMILCDELSAIRFCREGYSDTYEICLKFSVILFCYCIYYQRRWLIPSICCIKKSWVLMKVDYVKNIKKKH